MEERKNISGRPATQIEIEMVGSIANLQDQLHEMKQSRDFYRLRVWAVEAWLRSVPEPYKTQVSDILANGQVAPWRVSGARPPTGFRMGKFAALIDNPDEEGEE